METVLLTLECSFHFQPRPINDDLVNVLKNILNSKHTCIEVVSLLAHSLFALSTVLKLHILQKPL